MRAADGGWQVRNMGIVDALLDIARGIPYVGGSGASRLQSVG